MSLPHFVETFYVNDNTSCIFCSTIKLGNGQNYENHNVKNQKELRKVRRQSEHRKDLLKQSERRKSKRSERRK